MTDSVYQAGPKRYQQMTYARMSLGALANPELSSAELARIDGHAVNGALHLRASSSQA